MNHLDDLNLLIDQAAAIAGSDSKVTAALGIPRQLVSMWRKGARPCQPEEQALLAELAGLDPVATLARATVQYWEGKPKGDKLRRALGKLSPVTGAAAGFVGAIALAIFGLTNPTPAQATTHSDLDNVRRGKRTKRNSAYVKPRFFSRRVFGA